jgi:Fic family protein
MNLKLEIEFSKAGLLQEVDVLKKQIDDMRPLPEDIEGRVMQKLRLDWNYHSNAIEGNRLSYGETVALIMEGITAGGKPLKDSFDILGHNEAIDFILSLVKGKRSISEIDIRSLHELVLGKPYDVKTETPDGVKTTKRIALGEYKKLPNHVKTSTGEIHYYSTPEETPAKMQELIEWFREVSEDSGVHPVIIAALFHHKFVAIHPFDDGNGRLSRILMNLILIQSGFPPVVIKTDDRQNYYSLLSRADNGDFWPFIGYIIRRLESSLQLFLKAALGGDINEDEDIDKEIALFKIELKNKVEVREKKSYDIVLKIIKTEIYPLFRKITIKANEFDEFFESAEKFIVVEIPQDKNGSDYRKIPFNSLEFDIELPIINSNYISYKCNFYEFKNLKNLHGISITWKINFDKYNYTIIDSSDKQVLSKYYDNSLSGAEKQRIIKYFINELKSAIKTLL